MDTDNESLLSFISKNNTNRAKLLIENGANVNLIDDSTGMSLLMIAAQKHNFTLCEMLLDYGADLYWKDNNGETIFDKFKDDAKLIIWFNAQAKRLNNQKFREAALEGDLYYIIEHFSYINKDTISWSFVHTPSLPILDFLLKEGVDINTQSTYVVKYGVNGGYHYTFTSLLDGCKQNNLDKVKWLLEHGAQLNITCTSAETIRGKDVYINEREELSALSFARANKNQEMIELLKAYLHK